MSGDAGTGYRQLEVKAKQTSFSSAVAERSQTMARKSGSERTAAGALNVRRAHAEIRSSKPHGRPSDGFGCARDPLLRLQVDGREVFRCP